VRHQSDTIELGNREREAVDTHEATRDKTEPNRVELFPTDHPQSSAQTTTASLPPLAGKNTTDRTASGLQGKKKESRFIFYGILALGFYRMLGPAGTRTRDLSDPERESYH